MNVLDNLNRGTQVVETVEHTEPGPGVAACDTETCPGVCQWHFLRASLAIMVVIADRTVRYSHPQTLKPLLNGLGRKLQTQSPRLALTVEKLSGF